MERLSELIKVAITGIVVVWSLIHPLTQALLWLMVIDIVTGLMAAYISRTINSTITYNGMLRKGLILMLIATAAVVEPAIGVPISAGVAGFFIVHESISILENASISGLPVPRQLRDALALVPGAEKQEKIDEGTAIPEKQKRKTEETKIL